MPFCDIASSTLMITQPSTLSASSSQTNVSCFGGNNGSATISTSNGTPPYTYSWSPNVGSGATVLNLSAGTYSWSVTDACPNDIASSTLTITQPNQLSVSISVNSNVSCNGLSNGSATATPAGGTSPYVYSWNTSPSQTNQKATGLSIGTYTVKVTDFQGCTASASIIITQPVILTASTTVNVNVNCNGGATGSATANPSGGTSPYLFSWNTSPVQAKQQATGLTAGNYTVTITDNHSCTVTALTTIITARCIDCLNNSEYLPLM